MTQPAIEGETMQSCVNCSVEGRQKQGSLGVPSARKRALRIISASFLLRSPFDQGWIVDLLHQHLNSLRERRNANRQANTTFVNTMERVLEHVVDISDVQLLEQHIAGHSAWVCNKHELERCRRFKHVDVVLCPLDEVHAAGIQGPLVGRDLSGHTAQSKKHAGQRDMEVWIAAKLANVLLGGEEVLVDLLPGLIDDPKQVHDHLRPIENGAITKASAKELHVAVHQPEVVAGVNKDATKKLVSVQELLSPSCPSSCLEWFAYDKKKTL
jgi:hypothetical protein